MRDYGGCEHVDRIESGAVDREKTLFDAEFANVQPLPARRPMTRRCSRCFEPAAP
ncbi:hypothetical protein [Burkholderia multivorans]|uniref:hypothetical protein n=1 Tax=Burkholderia multivorans TaxID=87883 RepID=UPI003BA9B813